MREETNNPPAEEMNFDPYSPTFLADPYPYYHMLRERMPVFRYGTGQWVLTRHRDCVDAMRGKQWSPVADFRCLPDSTSTSPTEAVTGPRSVIAPARENGETAEASGVEYKTFRKPLSGWLSPSVTRKLEASIQQTVDELVDRALAKQEVDLVTELSNPLTSTVFCRMLGVPASDQHLVTDRLSAMLGGNAAPSAAAEKTGDDGNGRDQAAAELSDYFGNLLAQRRGDPRDDIISTLSATVPAGDRLAEQELIATCVLILAAGHGPTTMFIACGALALLRNPDVPRLLRSDPDLMPAAIEEMLRYDAGAQFIVRTPRDEIELDGQVIKPGELVVGCVGAANRDPDVFEDPDRFDLSRTTNPHLSFGDGPQFCPGASLARAEARLFFGTLLRRAPRLELAGNPRYEPWFPLRGLVELPVSVR